MKAYRPYLQQCQLHTSALSILAVSCTPNYNAIYNNTNLSRGIDGLMYLRLT